MPRPTSSTAIQRPDLGAIAWEFLIDAEDRGFIGASVFPVFEVPEQSSDYPIIPIEALIKDVDLKRAPRSDYQRDDWEFETGTYKAQEYGFEQAIDDVEARLYNRFFDAEVIATQIGIDKVLRAHEKRVAAVLETGAADTDVTTEWDTPATATPLADVELGIEAMRAASGVVPNVVAMSWSVFKTVLRTEEIQNTFRFTNPIETGTMEAKERLLAQYFGVDRILVGGGQKDSAKKGQSSVLADIWNPEFVHLLKVSDGGNSLRDPVIGRTFLWSEDAPGIVVTESYRQEEIRSDIIRARMHTDEAIIFAGAHYKLGNILSTAAP